jgi:hypothetical protein
MTTKEQIQADGELIAQLGGASALARQLGFKSKQRVHNWFKRGIPPAVKLTFPKIFLKKAVKK